MIERPDYVERILQFSGSSLIKVLSGIRRSGKSTILVLLKEALLWRGSNPDTILHINMENLENDGLRHYSAMYEYIKEKLPHGGYLLLDEVQEIEGWERVLASVLAEGKIDCTITGSNARLLSSELATLLAGRYIEIPIFTLSFREFILFAGQSNNTDSRDALFRRYLTVGGFPGIHSIVQNDGMIRSYLESLVDSIVLKDVVKRHAIRDVDTLDRVLRFAMDNAGNLLSARSVHAFFLSQGRSISADKVREYLSYLCGAFALYKVRRFDLRGKRHLEYAEKYYPGDIGLRHGLIGSRDRDISGLMESIVYLELRRRGWTVSIGVWDNLEVDFVAERGSERRYYQVCYLLSDESVIKREFGNLAKIPDNYPKLVLSLDEVAPDNIDGIRRMDIRDFLLEPEQTS